MSNESHYAESESVLTEESEAPNSILIDQLRSKIEQESRKVNEKVQILQIKLSDAEIENANYKKRIAKLENTVHTQGHKIDQLETSLEEKILENEKQRLNCGAEDRDFSVGKSKLHFSNEMIKLPGGDLKWCKRLSITHEVVIFSGAWFSTAVCLTAMNQSTFCFCCIESSAANSSTSSAVNLQNLTTRVRRYSFQTQQAPSADSIDSPTGRARLLGRIRKHRVSYPHPSYPLTQTRELIQLSNLEIIDESNQDNDSRALSLTPKSSTENLPKKQNTCEF
ncbi:Oidioi.mRNA.OKI2018_I69.chr1.g1489.t1.cds [Oikopleura dioica]|uniref:Oidioi.mRNA.OKI2018_I69.chr1.g1489.t1.cds n=1 Tax=Oikopleura dioica TaxID=34765 RepID=A0ABN7SXA8_OIKDI|nr:Oidioi.mRNA.OKI2018_I69.chr1.g1489.t1.cds [Oikopleura dioica]